MLFVVALNLSHSCFTHTVHRANCRNDKVISKKTTSRFRWSLLHGNFITGGIASLSGALLNYHYRQQFKLRTYGRWISYAPVIIIPFMTAAAFETITVTLPLVSGQINCPLCAEIRYASLQVCLGFAQPWLLSVLGSTALSKTFSTIAMPPDWAGIAAMHGRMARRAQVPMVSLFALNIIAAMIIAQEQGKASLKLLTKQVQGQMDD